MNVKIYPEIFIRNLKYMHDAIAFEPSSFFFQFKTLLNNICFENFSNLLKKKKDFLNFM